MLGALVVAGALLHVGSACSDPVQGTAICQLAAGFSPLPSDLSTTWKCDSTGAPLSEPCTWEGIACDPSCRIVALNLGNAGLSGTISSYVGQLTNLEGLFLYSNSIGSSIPPEIGYLQNLQLLTLDHTKLSGAFPKICSGAAPGYNFPPGAFIGLTNLRLLTVDNTNVNCYPSCFFKTFSSNGLWAMTISALADGYGIYTDPGISFCPRKDSANLPSSADVEIFSLQSYADAYRKPSSNHDQSPHCLCGTND